MSQLVTVQSSRLRPSCVYTLRIGTTGTPTMKQAEAVAQSLSINWGMIPLEVWTKANEIWIKIKTSRFYSYAVPLPLLFTALPEIMTTVGLVLSGVGIFLAVGHIPTWMTVVIVVGLALVLAAPAARYIQVHGTKATLDRAGITGPQGIEHPIQHLELRERQIRKTIGK